LYPVVYWGEARQSRAHRFRCSHKRAFAKSWHR